MIRMLLVATFFMFSKISVSPYIIYYIYFNIYFRGEHYDKRRDSSSIQIPQSSKKKTTEMVLLAASRVSRDLIKAIVSFHSQNVR